jgi:hypothetical protein
LLALYTYGRVEIQLYKVDEDYFEAPTEGELAEDTPESVVAG